MIDLYTWGTPNGRKVSIMLEELGVPYSVHPIDIGKGAQFDPAFLAVAPNNRIPAIVDRGSGLSLMESGAILIYLAEKFGRFMSQRPEERYHTIEWVMWQMGGFGPMLGQAHHFLRFNKGKSAYAEERYAAEAKRLYGVLDRRLAGRDYVVGEYSIADMAIWPWASRFEWQNIDMREFPNVARWYRAVAARPAVRRGYDVPVPGGEIPMPPV